MLLLTRKGRSHAYDLFSSRTFRGTNVVGIIARSGGYCDSRSRGSVYSLKGRTGTERRMECLNGSSVHSGFIDRGGLTWWIVPHCHTAWVSDEWGC